MVVNNVHGEIKRVAYTHQGTFGVFKINEEPIGVIAEEVWRNNQPNISCIPEGRFLCERGIYYPKHGDPYESFMLLDVPKRDRIWIHIGNSIMDTLGCILIAERFEHINDMFGVWTSRAGFDEMMERLKGIDQWMLNITY